MNGTDAAVSALFELARKKDRVIAAIDGRCAAGKTTLAERISKELDCNIFHMDDFFLRPEQRTPQRLELPGGNIDSERFLGEVLLPLSNEKNVIYKPYNCQTGKLGDAVSVPQKRINIVEGSYSCHPDLRAYYDFCIFLDVDSDEQLRRITVRDPDKAERFRSIWIPLEEKYFSAFDIQGSADMTVKT